MISLQLIVPLVVAALASVAATASHRRLPPRIAAPMLTLTIVAVALAVAPAMLVIAVGYLAHMPWLGGAFAWCRDALGVHAPIPPWMGMSAVAILGCGVVRMRTVLRTWRFFRRSSTTGGEVIPSEALFAYTLPGPGAHVVVSSALAQALDPVELAVVLAHERAHADHRHDRYVLTAELANALLPIVRPLQRRLVFVLERWADETAVVHANGDRNLVARTLARVALSSAVTPPGAAMGIAGLGVAGRVQALLEPPVIRRSALWVSVMAAGITVVGVAAVVQLHHVLPLLVALCLGDNYDML